MLTYINLHVEHKVPTLVTLDYGGVTEVDFSTSDNFVMDNVTILTANSCHQIMCPSSPLSPASGLASISVTIFGTDFILRGRERHSIFWRGAGNRHCRQHDNLVVTVPAGATYAPISETVNGLTAYANQPFMPIYSAMAQVLPSIPLLRRWIWQPKRTGPGCDCGFGWRRQAGFNHCR